MIVKDSTLEDLRTAFQRQFDAAYRAMAPETFWMRVALLATSSSTSNTYGWLGQFPGLREWIGDRVVQSIKEDSYQITNKTWEDTLGVMRTDVEDDNLGVYSGLIEGLAQQAAEHPDLLIAQLMAEGESRLCYDGQNFYDTDHPVYANADGLGAATVVSNYDDASGSTDPGWHLLDCRNNMRPFIFQRRMAPELESKTSPSTSDSVFMKDAFLYGVRARHAVGYGFWQKAMKSRRSLDLAAFREARAEMRGWTGDGGRKLGVRPTHLVVGASLQSAAEDLIERDLIDGGNRNPAYKALEVVVSDWLD